MNISFITTFAIYIIYLEKAKLYKTKMIAKSYYSCLLNSYLIRVC